MKVLVCGGRDFRDAFMVNDVLNELNRLESIDCIVHGAARGADMLAHSWAVGVCEIECFKADWTRYGASAGPRRNEQMLTEGRPDVVLAFPGGRGTEDMKRRAREHGAPILLATDRSAWLTVLDYLRQCGVLSEPEPWYPHDEA